MKDLILQLNKLKELGLDKQVKTDSRKLLPVQISQGEEIKSLSFGAKFYLISRRFLQPYAVASMIFLFFLVSGFVSWKSAAGAQPGDSLYLAKRLSERTKMMMAFSDKGKAKLNLEFAGNRAKEMSLLAQGNDSKAKNDLKNEFQKQIDNVKARLASKFNIKKQDNQSDKEMAKNKEEYKTAGVDKTGKKIDISVSKNNLATTTAEVSNTGLVEVLEEAEKLMENENYDQVNDKLNQASELLDQVEQK